MNTTTRISIEKIATGTIIEVPGFGAAEMYECTFDGEGYSVVYCRDDRFGWDALDSVYFAPGTMVEAWDHQTFLRAEKSITTEELEAKIAANDAAADALIGQINAASGYVCRPVDEAALVGAVADALGVPALEAAE